MQKPTNYEVEGILISSNNAEVKRVHSLTDARQVVKDMKKQPKHFRQVTLREIVKGSTIPATIEKWLAPIGNGAYWKRIDTKDNGHIRVILDKTFGYRWYDLRVSTLGLIDQGSAFVYERSSYHAACFLAKSQGLKHQVYNVKLADTRDNWLAYHEVIRVDL